MNNDNNINKFIWLYCMCNNSRNTLLMLPDWATFYNCLLPKFKIRYLLLSGLRLNSFGIFITRLGYFHSHPFPFPILCSRFAALVAGNDHHLRSQSTSDPIEIEVNQTLFQQVKLLGFDPPVIWKSGNLPYLVSNTYGLHFIKIGGVWLFRGAEAPY